MDRQAWLDLAAAGQTPLVRALLRSTSLVMLFVFMDGLAAGGVMLYNGLGESDLNQGVKSPWSCSALRSLWSASHF